MKVVCGGQRSHPGRQQAVPVHFYGGDAEQKNNDERMRHIPFRTRVLPEVVQDIKQIGSGFKTTHDVLRGNGNIL
jgi:hypothetical protein